jgi:hypothetical protein
VFAYPIGPGSVENTFLHAGGEAIFSLPNGLQGYYIMDANNARLNKAPTAIVSDPKRPDKAVELGVSCIGCHVPGIHAKADQIHDHVRNSPRAVPKADADLALALYPPKETSLAQMEEDAKKFQAALALTGTPMTRNEPVLAMTLRYEGDVDGPAAAAEAGLSWDEFQKRLADSDALSRAVGSLRVAGGTVARQVWVQAFGDVVRELRLGALFQAGQIGASLPDNTGEVDPLEVSAGQANQMAFSTDGRRAVIADADRSVRYHEVEGRRDLKRLVGHTASVWSVALSTDGKRALSGGMDGSVRVWDVQTGLQTHRFDGHTGLVTAVAFAPENRVITGGLDGFVIVWDGATGREIRRWRGPMKYVATLAVSSDGRLVAIGADRVVRLWDSETGKERRTLKAHIGPVTSVAFSADGTRIITGSDDRTIRLWEAVTGKPIRIWTGHEGAVRSVALSANGKWALSAGADATVRLWKLSDDRAAAVFRQHRSAVVQAAFAANGRQTVSGDRDGATLIWDIGRFLSKSPGP